MSMPSPTSKGGWFTSALNQMRGQRAAQSVAPQQVQRGQGAPASDEGRGLIGLLTNAPAWVERQREYTQEQTRREQQQAVGLREERDRTATSEAVNARDLFTSALGEGNNEWRELSAEEYYGLNPAQQAAIDANTLLRTAIEADLAGSGSGDADYHARVNRIFGEEGGSDTYAPRTIAALELLGYESPVNDLDNFLNTSALVNDRDLALVEDLTTPMLNYSGSAGPQLQDPEEARRHTANSLARGASSALSETLARGQTLLNHLRTVDSDLFGIPDALPPGFNPAVGGDMPRLMDTLYHGALMDEFTDNNQFRVFVDELQSTYQLRNEDIYQYLDARLRSQARQGFPEGALDEATFRSRWFEGGN